MAKVGTFLGVPYDWRKPTRSVIRKRMWNPRDRRLFTRTCSAGAGRSTSTSCSGASGSRAGSDSALAPAGASPNNPGKMSGRLAAAMERLLYAGAPGLGRVGGISARSRREREHGGARLDRFR